MSVEEQTLLAIAEDKGWRIRELSEVVRACKDSTGVRQSALIRATVPVIYAHWEGFFVFSINKYLNCVAEKGIMLTRLRHEFWALTIRKRVRPQQLQSEAHLNKFLIEIRSEADQSFKKGRFDRINGMANLRSDVVKWCCSQIGFSAEIYDEYYKFIDEKLVDKRNYIAHGESIRIDIEAVIEYRNNVIELMRITENEIENAITLRKYLS
jgi:hypothetical protein